MWTIHWFEIAIELQLMAYLLLSAASSAVPLTNRMRENNDNIFTDSSVAAISMEFLAFFALAVSALISGHKLSNKSYIWSHLLEIPSLIILWSTSFCPCTSVTNSLSVLIMYICIKNYRNIHIPVKWNSECKFYLFVKKLSSNWRECSFSLKSLNVQELLDNIYLMKWIDWTRIAVHIQRSCQQLLIKNWFCRITVWY